MEDVCITYPASMPLPDQKTVAEYLHLPDWVHAACMNGSEISQLRLAEYNSGVFNAEYNSDVFKRIAVSV